MASLIHFYSENTSFIPKRKRFLRDWISFIINKEGKTPGELNFIFCSDDYLLQLNKQYLKRNYLTDIITFDYSDGDALSGDIYISIDRVRENSKGYNVSFEDELHRVIVHGVLHLSGFKDKTREEKEKMREKENKCLEARKYI